METDIKQRQYPDFTWIDICNPDPMNLDSLAKEYDLDYFQIRDSLEVGHLPKFEKHETYTFIILRAFTADPDERNTNITDLSNKIAFFYNDKKIITIHRSSFEFTENPGKEFTHPEGLLLFLIHKMLQTYENPLKQLSEKNDEMERIVFLKDYAKISLEELYFLKTQTRITKKLLQVIQNVVHQVEVGETYRTALQDIRDQLLSLVMGYEEVLDYSYNLLNTYLSVNARKNNDIIKTLTIFSAFFLPLTFIAGIYGMNFQNMPELRWNSGYFLALGFMLLVAVFIYLWFRRKKIF